MPKRFPFFFIFFNMLVQNCESFTWFSHKLAEFYTEQCTNLSLFHTFEASQGCSNWSLKNYGFISNANFKNCTHVHKSLSSKTIIIQDCWIRNTVVCIKTGRFFGIHCWLSVWREPGQWFHPTSTQEAYEDKLAALGGQMQPQLVI